ncbi:MAG: site-2 protease family protein [Acidimicrobiia bacterium]|nr:site-2 protease family protein [Acidimicrobiia bacterium]
MPLGQALTFFGCLVVAVIFHEISHGLAALAFGDDTAKRAGRLTLNPVPHIDPFGSIVLPAMGALTGLPVIAWAKPVPVSPGRLRNPRRDMLVVSLAGPFTNFLLMGVAALAVRSMLGGGGFVGLDLGDRGSELLVDVLFAFAVVNLFLGVFNLLPIPPLDGSALLERVLPREWLPGWYRFRPYGILVLFLLIFSGLVDIGRVLTPCYDALVRFVVG